MRRLASLVTGVALATAVGLMPLSVASAQTRDGVAFDPEAAIEAAAAALESRMEDFAARAEAIEQDETLTGTQKATAIATLWAEYQPDFLVFTQAITSQSLGLAAEALAGDDVDSLVAGALNMVSGLGVPGLAEGLAVGQGLVTNGAWVSDDPEHLETYGLIADYALGEALEVEGPETH